MGQKYSSNSASGYNATPPADDGTVSEANKGKWSTIKTKLADPVKDLVDTINTELVTHFDNGPVAYTDSQTIGTSHYGQTIQISGASKTLTLTDAATLGAGFNCEIVSVDATNTVAVARATASDMINETTANLSLFPLQSFSVVVNAAANGFLVNQTIRAGKKTETFSGPDSIINIGIASSVAAKALTIAIKTRLLADPSSLDPVQIAFRNATLTTGDYVIRSITAATSVVGPSGSTFGYAAGATGYLYIYALDNAGTVEAAISGSNNWDEATVQSTTAIGTGSDSGSVLYSTSARTNVSIRYIGRIKIATGAVAGEWDNEDTEAHVGSNTGSTLTDIGLCEGRLTLTTGTPVTTADVNAATTIYFTPYRGNRIALYDGSANWTIMSFAELSLAIPAVATTMHDVFAYNNSGVVAIEALAWTNDNARATALTLQNGVLVKTGATTRRYIGSFRTIASGQTEDSFDTRYVWNYYNRVRRLMQVTDSTNSWVYSSNSIRQANGASTNQLNFIVGWEEDLVSAEVVATASCDAVGSNVSVYIGLNDTTAANATAFNSISSTPVASQAQPLYASWSGYPSVGKHYLAWLEAAGNSGITTWYGDTFGILLPRSGISGIVIG